MKKTILITGSMGFIGKNLIKQLLNSSDYYKIIEWDEKGDRDIFDQDFVDAVANASIVVHLAAEVSVQKSFKYPKKTYRTNVLGTARVLEACLKYKKKLVYLSSASVANADSSPYALSKALAETLVFHASKFIPTVILRLYNVYGEGMSRATGPVMYQFLKGKDLLVRGDGRQTRDFINVKDVCSIIESAFEKKWDGKIVEVGTGEPTSINKIAKIFAKYQDKRIYYVSAVSEVRYSRANTELLSRLYRRKLKTNLEEDIKGLCEL